MQARVHQHRVTEAHGAAQRPSPPIPRSPTHPVATRRHALLAGAVLPTLLINAREAIAAAAADTSAASAFAAAAPAVVALGTVGPGDAFTALASGLVWTSAGHIVTAYSPVNPALRQAQRPLMIAVAAPDGRLTLRPVAAVVAREPSLDLMILLADFEPGQGPSPPLFARSSALKVGQELTLIGSTAEGGRAASSGVLSATGRVVPAPNGQAIRGALQTDADVTALGLGGALVDGRGAVVGLPTVSYARPGAGRSSGVSFAVPSDTLLEAVPRLIAYGNIAGRR